MIKRLKIAVYCRTSVIHTEDLLEEQEKILLEFAEDNNMEVIDVVKDISDGKNLKSDGIKELMNKITHHQIDAIVYYDMTRIAVYDDLYVEFELICQKYEVFLIPLRPLIIERNL